VREAIQTAVPSGEWNSLVAAAGPERLLAFCEKFAAALGVAVGAKGDLTWVGPATEAFDQWAAEHQKNGTTFDPLAAWLEATNRAAGVMVDAAPAPTAQAPSNEMEALRVAAAECRKEWNHQTIFRLIYAAEAVTAGVDVPGEGKKNG
jgi:hypothetical protein